MGKHSSSEQWPFYRSVIVWFLPWVIIASLLGAAVIFAVNTLSDDGLTTPPPAADGNGRDRDGARETPEETPAPDATLEETPAPDETIEPSPTPEEVELITEGITVQVLNASPSTEADDEVAARLEDAGFSIVSFADAATQYEETTVLWATDEFKKAAKAMASEFGWVAQAQPGNLSTSVSIHVVVGADEAV